MTTDVEVRDEHFDVYIAPERDGTYDYRVFTDDPAVMEQGIAVSRSLAGHLAASFIKQVTEQEEHV